MSAPRPIVGVAGLGLLGRGITACLLAHGFDVFAYAHYREEFAQAEKHIDTSLNELVDHAGFSRDILSTWRARYRPVQSLSEMRSCTFLIESVVEDLAIKRTVFDALEQAVAGDVPIASNTSALPISILQSGRCRPERLIGMHWSEPAHVTRFLEIIRGNQTNDATATAAIALGVATGKEPSLVQRDVPGFITNRLMYAVIREALHLLESGVADVETIDRSFRNDIGWWATIAGPFRWMDLTGLPSYATVAQNLFPSLSNATDVPSSLRQLAASGAKGTADGRGFYQYDQNAARHWEEVWAQFTWDIRQLAQKYTPLNNPPSAAPPVQP